MTQDLAALASDCRTAADTLADMRTFQTGQGILRQAADALEAQAAEIARLTARAEKAEAALSESQAMLAMWPEVAATEVEAWGMPSGSAPAAIRALTTADAQAALDARINAAREEGLRLAAKICTRGDDRAAILAKIKEAE